ncbi:MAG: S-adenosylmethionine:tRNA ribosyltransferase-isomerase, partial [Runella sp.]
MMTLDAYQYDLPESRIAQYPAEPRDSSKLLLYQKGQIVHKHFFDLPDQLPPDSFLVFNDTKVVEARLLFQKPTGGAIELFCLEPADQYADITSAMLQKGSVQWKCLVGGAKKWKE